MRRALRMNTVAALALVIAAGPAAAGLDPSPRPGPIDLLSRTLAELPADQTAVLNVELLLRPKPELRPAAQVDGLTVQSPMPRKTLGLRREYPLPPASPESRSAELQRLLDELRQALAHAAPDLDVSFKMNLRLSSPSAAGAERASPLLDYLARVRALIERRKAYPSIARQLRLEGRVLLRTLIQADGSLGDAFVLASAGGQLDRAALTAVRRAGPFPPPTELGLDSVSIEVPIAYVLR